MEKINFVIVTVAVCFIFCIGAIIVLYPKEEPQRITTIVNQPATDEQLLEFWFGNGDKASLRKRICK